jgi:hypothetical protein
MVMLQNMIDVASNSWILHATLHAVLYVLCTGAGGMLLLQYIDFLAR